MATAYQTSPYRFPVVGWMHDLDSMTIEDLQDWYKRYYAPSNAIVVVAGDVEPENVYQLAKKYFGPLPKGKPITMPLDREIPQQGLKRVTVKRQAELPYLLMAYKTPTENPDSIAVDDQNWEPYALEVLAGILDGGNSARLSSRLVRGSEVAASVGASYRMASRLDNLFMLIGTPSEGKTVEELELALRKEILELQTTPVSEEELQRVKAQVISSDVYEKDSVFNQAMIIGMLETIGLPWQLAESYVERVNAITAEQVMQVAKKYFNDDQLTVAELEPLPMDGKQLRRPAGGMGRVH